ncbi:hypothetical protein QE152_g7815 [Popillia japonica]|uniref:Uncharacterized protein n=1 Tax=Popillia japonica TaxID=7064 RepID=A0AAW1MDG5_POPJA
MRCKMGIGSRQQPAVRLVPTNAIISFKQKHKMGIGSRQQPAVRLVPTNAIISFKQKHKHTDICARRFADEANTTALSRNIIKENKK